MAAEYRTTIQHQGGAALVKTYLAGVNVSIKFTIERSLDPYVALAFIDPATSITISIWNPLGLRVVNEVAMTKSVVGKYYYVMQSSTDDTDDLGKLGEFFVRCSFDDTPNGTGPDFTRFALSTEVQ